VTTAVENNVNFNSINFYLEDDEIRDGNTIKIFYIIFVKNICKILLFFLRILIDR